MSAPRDARLSPVHPAVRSFLAQAAPADADARWWRRLESYAAARRFPIVGAEAGAWLERLVRTTKTRRMADLGAGWGYSALWLSRGAGPGAEVHAVDGDPASPARFARLCGGHPAAAAVQYHTGEALAVLAGLPGDFDAIFVDIDKEAYPAALAAAVPRLRPGGLLLVDNVLWGGKVVDPAPADPATAAVVRFVAALLAHPGLDAGVLPVGDGLAVGWKRL